MIHDIEFHLPDGSTKSSLEDYKMVLVNKKIEIPKPRLTHVVVPGRDGFLDLTDAIDGLVHYDARTISCEFVVPKENDWETTISNIINGLHGKSIYFILWDEPSYRYYGRAVVNEYKSDKSLHTISIDFICDPFRYKEKMKSFSAPSNSDQLYYWKISDSKAVQQDIIVENVSQTYVTVTINGRKINLSANQGYSVTEQLKVGPLQEHQNEIRLTALTGPTAAKVNIIYQGGDI